MNSFLDSNRKGEPRRPEERRVYARITSIEPEPESEMEGPRVVLFEAIDADQFDGIVSSAGQNDSVSFFGEFAQKGRISALEANEEKGFDFASLQGADEEDWIEIRLEEPSGGESPILQYTNLFSEPVARSMSIMKHISKRDGELALELDRMMGTDAFSDADPLDIRRAFSGDTIVGAAAYDVGQGSWQGLLNCWGIPIAYFDLGGGVLGHVHSFPPEMNKACFVRKPPVVLSHWDWDHWSSAQRFIDALAMTWIVPRQPLGPVQRVFLYNLEQHGKVLFWPSGLASLRSGQVEIRKCIGRGMNHSGLALSVSSPSCWQNRDILFTGDCDYRHIPGWDNTYRHVLVPHHGAKMPSSAVPSPECRVRSTATISRGHENRWHHPNALTISRHDAAGWTKPKDLGRDPRINDNGDHHLLFWDDDLTILAKLSDGWPNSGLGCCEHPSCVCDMEHFTT